MAERAVDALSRILADLPKDHPHRTFLQAQLDADKDLLALERRSAPSSELDLEKEWQRQAENFVEFGFHKKRRMMEGEYLDSLPRFTPQPEQFKGRFDIPLLVETRIPVKEQARLAGVGYYLEGLRVRDWEEDTLGYKTPDNPYTTWVQDGTKYLKVAVQDVRKKLDQDERGGTEFDGIAFYIAYPEVFKDHSIDLPGTSVGSDEAPDLGLFSGGPELDSSLVGNAHPRFGSLSCGRS